MYWEIFIEYCASQIDTWLDYAEAVANSGKRWFELDDLDAAENDVKEAEHALEMVDYYKQELNYALAQVNN